MHGKLRPTQEVFTIKKCFAMKRSVTTGWGSHVPHGVTATLCLHVLLASNNLSLLCISADNLEVAPAPCTGVSQTNGELTNSHPSSLQLCK